MSILTACFCILAYLVGSNIYEEPTYQLPLAQFCYCADSSQWMQINEEDQQYIFDLLNNATWKEDSGNCDSEYTFHTRSQQIQYHSLCGTFHDTAAQTSTTLTLEQRNEVNKLLGITSTDIAPEASPEKYKLEVSENLQMINQLDTQYAPGEEITVILPRVTDVSVAPYVNGVRHSTHMDDNYLFFTFVMPCEDVQLEENYEGRWGRCYFPHLPHPDWLHSSVCEGY